MLVFLLSRFYKCSIHQFTQLNNNSPTTIRYTIRLQSFLYKEPIVNNRLHHLEDYFVIYIINIFFSMWIINYIVIHSSTHITK